MSSDAQQKSPHQIFSTAGAANSSIKSSVIIHTGTDSRYNTLLEVTKLDSLIHTSIPLGPDVFQPVSDGNQPRCESPHKYLDEIKNISFGKTQDSSLGDSFWSEHKLQAVHAASALGSETVGDGASSPRTMNTMYHRLYFLPRANCVGEGLIVSFDLLNFSPDDATTGSLILDRVTIGALSLPASP
jgi:hypothetical protein